MCIAAQRHKMTMMFSVLRAALFTNEQITLSDWQPIFEEMKQQTVAALPCNILPAEATKWRAYCMKKQGQAIRVLHAQNELISLLESNGISCVILKGAAAAMAYPYPTLRTMGDVDFLVKRCDLDRTAKLLEENGYLLVHDKERESHHYAYKKDKISFELHWRIPLISEDDEKRMALFEEGIDNRELHEIEGYRFPVLPILFNGLVLIFHIDQHLRSGLGLRQIVDWMMYVHSNLDDVTWETEFMLPAREAGLEKLAVTLTYLCRKWLGLSDEITWCAGADDVTAFLATFGTDVDDVVGTLDDIHVVLNDKN